MRLKNYLFKNNMTGTHLAKEIGVHPSYLSSIINEKHIPSMKLCRKIEDVTDGAVTILELLQLSSYQPMMMD